MMLFNFHANGDIFRWTGEVDDEYVGKIDSEGNFLPVSEKWEMYEGTLRAQCEEAIKNEPNFDFGPEHALFVGADNPEISNHEDWRNAVIASITRFSE